MRSVATRPLSPNQTSALAASPFSSGPILSLQPRTDLEQRGVQPVVRERGGNDWRLTGGRTGRVWRETFGSNKSIRALFSSQSESGSAATVSLGYWRVKSAQTLYTYQLQLTLAPRSLKYVQHRKAASASF